MAHRNDYTVNFTQLLLNCLGDNPIQCFPCLNGFVISLWRQNYPNISKQKKVNGQPAGKRIGADTDQEGWIPEWGLCIYWYLELFLITFKIFYHKA